jgi:hypothetical protein
MVQNQFNNLIDIIDLFVFRLVVYNYYHLYDIKTNSGLKYLSLFYTLTNNSFYY